MNFASSALKKSALGLLISVICGAAFAQQALYVPGGTVGNISGNNVGIGTATPATRLMVADDNVTSGGVTIGTGTAADGGNLRLLSSTNHWNLDNYAGDLRFFVETGYGAGGAVRMTLTKEGNLTVGGTFTAGNYAASGGSITGGSTGLVINSGGTNQNITLTPSGNGRISFGGDIAGINGGKLLWAEPTSLSDGIGRHTINNSSGPNVGAYQFSTDTGTTAYVGIGSRKLGTSPTGAADAILSRLALNATGSDGTTWSIGASIDLINRQGANWGNAYYTASALSFKTGRTSAGGLVETLRLSEDGNVGIGTTSPAGVGGTTLMLGTSSYGSTFRIKDSGVANADFGLLVSTGGSTPLFRFFDFANWADRMVISGAGNVGIGTTDPTHKLAVNGTIRAKEVIVDTGWADYVFADDYRLAPLAEVEAHIKDKGHLPGIPSAAEVAEHGVSMGEMQAKMMAKIEELTLHMIELKKENVALRREVEALKQSIHQ